MLTDARIEANAIDNTLHIQFVCHRIAVQLVKKRNPHGKISVGEQLDRFGFGGTHVKRFNLFFLGTVLQQSGKGACGRCVVAHNYA